MSDENFTWEDYYQKMQGREPRPLLKDVLKTFDKEASQDSRFALDLGCGDGTETVALLAHGWNVLAIDGEPAAIRHLLEKVPKVAQVHLQTQVAKFEEVLLPAADLVHASFSLPFCRPEYFEAFWQKIVNAVKPGGRFAGQFFGVKDAWSHKAELTFHTETQIRALLEKFEIESFLEVEEDGQTANGPKHWHFFTVIARKK